MMIRCRLKWLVIASLVALAAPLSLSAAEKVILGFQAWEASPLETQAISKGIARFIEMNPNVEVQYNTVPWAEHHPKLKTSMAAGNAPDVFFLHPDFQRNFERSGSLLEITDFILQNFKLEDFVQASRECMKVKFPSWPKERIYGIPSCIVGPVLFYNKDLFDKAGVPYPPTELSKAWSYDEFVGYMKKLTIKQGGKTVQYGTWNYEENVDLYTQIESLLSNGAQWFNSDYTKCDGINSPETREVLQKIKDLRVKYGVSPDASVAGMETAHSPTAMLETGRIATEFLGSYGLQQLAKTNLKLGAGAPIKWKKGIVSTGSADIKAIWSGTKHPKEAMELVKFFASPEFSTPIIRTGLWMPTRTEFYTNKEKVAEWHTNVYPDGWLNMLDLWKNSNVRWWDKLINTDQIYDIVNEEFQAFYNLNKPLDEVLPRLAKRIQPLLSY